MNILIFAGGGIGDVLMTTPMFRAIKQQYRDYKIFTAVMGGTQQTILTRNKNVDFVINITSKNWSGFLNRVKLILFLRKQKFEYVFFNHISDRQIFFILAFLGRIKNRVGLDKSSVARSKLYRIYSLILTRKYPYVFNSRKRTELNLELLKELNIKNNDFSYELPMSNNSSTNEGMIIVGIHPGSKFKGELKRWDINNFNELGKLINSKYNFKIRLFIGPEDKDLENQVNRNFEIIENLKFEDALQKVSECNYFISNDSGLAHVAAAFKIPTIVIFGPTSKNEYILPTKFLAVEKDNLECRPCFHLRKPCLVNQKCLKDISVKNVLDSFEQLVR